MRTLAQHIWYATVPLLNQALVWNFTCWWDGSWYLREMIMRRLISVSWFVVQGRLPYTLVYIRIMLYLEKVVIEAPYLYLWIFVRNWAFEKSLAWVDRFHRDVWQFKTSSYFVFCKYVLRREWLFPEQSCHGPACYAPVAGTFRVSRIEHNSISDMAHYDLTIVW